jgi:iron(III) transport system substrate-binding protein
VTVYCSVDSAFAEPVLAAFEAREVIRVHRVFDTEAGKTTGLVNRLLAERGAPRADVWWSGEIFGTIQLARAGVLAAHHPATAGDIPAAYRDPGGMWTATGLRGRVIAYDPRKVSEAELPRRWSDVTGARWKGRFALADPRFGTTRGHAATLLHLWGPDRFKAFLRAMKANDVRRSDGNAHSVLLLTRGVVDIVATDTDDVLVAQRRGESVAMAYPSLSCDEDSPAAGDAPPGGARADDVPSGGTLWIPSSAALVRGGPNAEAGRRLVDYLVSAEVERMLAGSASGNVPVRAALRAELKMSAPGEATVNYAAAAAMLDESDRLVTSELLE